MENKTKTEEFDSTEIKIEEIESDISDDWEFMSKYEVGKQSVPHLSVPKMREFIEESDSTSYRIGIDSDRGNEQATFSKHVQESERGRKDEVKQGQLPQYKQYKESEKCKNIEEMVQAISFLHDQEKENERLQKEMEEAMQERFQSEMGNERFRRKIVEAVQDLNQNDPEKDRLRREMVEAMQDLNQNDPEKDRLKRELHEARLILHQNEQEIDGLRRELRDLKQALHQKEKEIYRLERKLYEAMLDAPQSEQENDRDERKMDEAMQDTEFTLRADECSKSQTPSTEGESSAKGKDEGKIKVFGLTFSEAFQQFFTTDTTQSAQVPTDAAENDKSEKKKYVELTPEQLELFRKAGIDIAPSSDEESKQ